jgi:hypothetical protein
MAARPSWNASICCRRPHSAIATPTRISA